MSRRVFRTTLGYLLHERLAFGVAGECGPTDLFGVLAELRPGKGTDRDGVEGGVRREGVLLGS